MGEVGESSRVEVGERGARVVVSATTIEREGALLDCKEGCSRQCRSELLVAACACLPWQLNHPVQAPTCVGDLQISCSNQVHAKSMMRIETLSKMTEHASKHDASSKLCVTHRLADGGEGEAK